MEFRLSRAHASRSSSTNGDDAMGARAGTRPSCQRPRIDQRDAEVREVLDIARGQGGPVRRAGGADHAVLHAQGRSGPTTVLLKLRVTTGDSLVIGEDEAGKRAGKSLRSRS